MVSQTLIRMKWMIWIKLGKNFSFEGTRRTDIYPYTHSQCIQRRPYLLHGKQHHFSIWRNTHWKGLGGSSSSKDAVGKGSSRGRCRWNASTAAATPSSFSISFAISIARDFTWKHQCIEKCYNRDRSIFNLLRDWNWVIFYSVLQSCFFFLQKIQRANLWKAASLKSKTRFYFMEFLLFDLLWSGKTTENVIQRSRRALLHPYVKEWAHQDIRITSGCSINLMASERFSMLSWEIGMGAGPRPLWWTLSPQKNWSPKKGTTVVGHCKPHYQH